jgi:hypothetical protein
MLGPQIGMGPMWLQGGKFKKCDELHVEPCDVDPTDQCCAVIPCTLCLIWEPEYGDDKGAKARFNTNAWRGTIAGAEFVAYWQRNYETNECEFIVTLDGAIISTSTCNYGVGCRDPGGSTETTIHGHDGTLTWEVYEKRPLPYNKDNCTDFFCGTCECTCRKLCVTVRAVINEYSVQRLEGSGIASDTSGYDCAGPTWNGTVIATIGPLSESVEVEFYLYRDEYTGNCWMGGAARGEYLTPQEVFDCASLQMTFTLSDDTTVHIACYECECNTSVCEFCCLPLDFSQPTFPAGFYANIPFSLDCGETSISGELATSNNLPCTNHVLYYGPVWSSPTQTSYVEDANGNCIPTPCTHSFTLVLECKASEFATGCEELVLWIGSNGFPLEGDDGTEPGSFGGFNSWIKISPTACSCDDVQGVAAIFNFNITIDCSGFPLGQYGACAGKPLNCCEYSCSGVFAI